MSVQLPANLAVSSSRSSFDLCCMKAPSHIDDPKNSMGITTSKGGDLTTLEVEELNSRVKPALHQEGYGCISKICRFITKISPGYRRSQSLRAAQIFTSYLQEKYGPEVTQQALSSVRWSSVSENLLLKDVLEIKKHAEKFFLQKRCKEYASGGMICEGDMCWIVQDGHWNPKIKVSKIDPSGQSGQIIEDFSEDIVADKLLRNTEATQQQIQAVIAGMKQRVCASKDCRVVVSSRIIDEYLVREIAEKQIEIDSMETFNLERANSFNAQDLALPQPTVASREVQEQRSSSSSSQHSIKTDSEPDQMFYANMMCWI